MDGPAPNDRLCLSSRHETVIFLRYLCQGHSEELSVPPRKGASGARTDEHYLPFRGVVQKCLLAEPSVNVTCHVDGQIHKSTVRVRFIPSSAAVAVNRKTNR